ncbi:hypothetical protein L2E82_30207 [Cichorium intybus]|uniref:Uncharacterized protein n=1 Tax=Cichorium intybus TaxID=13427 RepID=A0ACB9CZX4_CICIN|nr:hypothetical protein L2E82_30207 [Cichorium intybus]
MILMILVFLFDDLGVLGVDLGVLGVFLGVLGVFGVCSWCFGECLEVGIKMVEVGEDLCAGSWRRFGPGRYAGQHAGCAVRQSGSVAGRFGFPDMGRRMWISTLGSGFWAGLDAWAVADFFWFLWYVPDPSLGEMKYTPIVILILDDEPAAFCAQIPHVMLSKVPMECNEVNIYRNNLVIPYPTHDLSQAAPVREHPKGKGKRKITGGPSGPKRDEKKRKASVKTTPKRKQPKRQRKLVVVDESSDSERTPSTVHEEEQEEEQFANQPPSPPPASKPLSPLHNTIPPSPPKTTRPPTPPHTIPPPPPPSTTAQQTTTIHITSSDIPPPPPPTTAPPTSEVHISGIDFSLPEFDLPPSPSRQNPTSAAFFEAFHLAPLHVEGVSDEDLPDKGFVLMKQYRVLNSKLDTLIQAQTGFDPTKPTLGDITEEIESLEFTMSKEINDSMQKLEKKLLDQQSLIQSSLEQKLESAVTTIDKKIEVFTEKVEKSNSEVLKTLQDLRSETQKSTEFEKQLDEARAKIEELTAAQAASDISKPQGRPTTAQHAGHASQGGERPRLISAATAGPSSSTIITTTMGASGSTGAGSSTDRSLESIIAPHMEEVYKARREDYNLMIKMNEFARDDADSEDLQLDILFNPKTFAFLQFTQSVTEDQKSTYWTNKIDFHVRFIQRQSVVWSLNKIKKILSIKEAEIYKSFRNYEFLVLRGKDEVESRFSIAGFPIMNPMDFIHILDLLRSSEAAYAAMSTFTIKNHILGFLNNYLMRFAKHDMELCSYYRQPLNTPPIVVRKIARFKNREIIDEPYGVVFKGLRNETEVTIKFFEIDYIGLHPSTFISGIISHVNACHANSTEKKKKFMDHMNWYLAIRKTLKRAYKRNFRE